MSIGVDERIRIGMMPSNHIARTGMDRSHDGWCTCPSRTSRRSARQRAALLEVVRIRVQTKEHGHNRRDTVAEPEVRAQEVRRRMQPSFRRNGNQNQQIETEYQQREQEVKRRRPHAKGVEMAWMSRVQRRKIGTGTSRSGLDWKMNIESRLVGRAVGWRRVLAAVCRYSEERSLVYRERLVEPRERSGQQNIYATIREM